MKIIIENIIGKDFYDEIKKSEVSNSTNRLWSLYIHIVPKELSNYEYDKYYVGITSRDVKQRWKNGKGYSNQKLFFRAIEKYGWDNIIHYVVSDKLRDIDVDRYERQLIEKLKSNLPMYGYNVNPGGISGGGGFSIKVAQYDLDGKLLGVYPSIADAKIRNNITEKSSWISAVIDKNRQSHGYMWRTINDYPLEQIEPYIPYSSNVIIEQYALDGTYIREWESIKAASEFYNTVAITNACRGKALTAVGFQWKYKDDTRVIQDIYNCDICKKRVYVYTISGEFINVYDSIVSAVKDLKIETGKKPYLDLSHCYKDIQKNYSHGYRWCIKYYEKLPPLKLKKTQHPIIKIKDNVIVDVYEMSSIAAKANGINISNIGAYCKGKEIDPNGYAWKYIDKIANELFMSDEIKNKYEHIRNSLS